MSRKSQVTPAERVTIMQLEKNGMPKSHIAKHLRRSVDLVSKVIREARETLENDANLYAQIHLDAARAAAKRGRGQPAQWALERLGVVKPAEPEVNKGVTVKIGVLLPGLQNQGTLASTAGVTVNSSEDE